MSAAEQIGNCRTWSAGPSIDRMDTIPSLFDVPDCTRPEKRAFADVSISRSRRFRRHDSVELGGMLMTPPSNLVHNLREQPVENQVG